MHFICVANGPSLRLAQIRSASIIRQSTKNSRIIAISDAMYVCAFADMGYSSDKKWWKAHGGMPMFRGTKFCVENSGFNDVIVLKKTGDDGFDPKPGTMRTGLNSGYQAVHLAAQYGADEITLLGYDFSNPPGRAKDHWFGAHPAGMNRESDMDQWRQKFRELTDALVGHGVVVRNATAGGTIKWLPEVDISDEAEDLLRPPGKPAP